MALLKGIELSRDLLLEAAALVKSIPDRALREYAGGMVSYRSGGFRWQNAASIRLHIEQEVRSGDDIGAELRYLLARHSLNPKAVAPFATAFLADHYHALIAVYGATPILLAMLLDKRQTVREQAAVRLRNMKEAKDAETPAAEPSEESPEHPLRTMRLKRSYEAAAPLKAFVDRLHLLAAAPGEEMEDSNSEELMAGDSTIAAIREELRGRNSEVRRLKSVEGRAKRLEKQLESEQSKTAHKVRQICELEDEIKIWRGRAQQAEANLGRRDASLEAQKAAEIETRLAREFGGWLAPPPQSLDDDASRDVWLVDASLMADKSQDTAAADPLIKRCRAALAAQEAQDRASHTRTRLYARLEMLESLLARAIDTLGNAMRPLPGLAASAAELRAECDRLRALLEIESETILPQIIATLNNSDEDELRKWPQTIYELERIALLDSGQISRLRRSLQRRQAIVAQSRPLPELREEDIATPAGRLQAMLRGQLAGVLLLDGHNVLSALQSRYFKEHYKHWYDARAREALVADIVRLTESRPTCRAKIVFDGGERSDHRASDNVSFTFSGGAGDDRADRVIEEEANYYRKAGMEHIVMVSNDGKLRGSIVKIGGYPLAPRQLLSFL